MKHKLVYTAVSRQDLDAIWDYIAFELQNLPAAERMIGRIMDTAEKLVLFPQSGALVSSVSTWNEMLFSDERFLVCEKYLIFYHLSPSEIYIDRVLYGGRDYLRILFGDPPKTP